MIELPTVAQINAISDVEALRGLCDEVERTIVQIESQLEFDIGDDGWAKRAANALALFRYTDRVLKRRLHKLTHREPERRRISKRANEDIHPLTLRAIQEPTSFDPRQLASVEDVDAAAADVVSTINAVEVDRADEISLLAEERDEGFLARTNGALRSLKALRMQLQHRRSGLAKEAKEAAHAERNADRKQRFIDAAKDLLPRETYDALWSKVFSEEVAA